jgi:hypothetical protein
MLEAYGANPFLVTLDNVETLMKKEKLLHLVYSFLSSVQYFCEDCRFYFRDSGRI